MMLEFSLFKSLFKSVDFINSPSPQRWSPRTCTVARGDPCHFVDAVNGFTLIWFANLAWVKQSRYGVGFFFVEVFTSKCWFRRFPRVLPQTCTVARGDPSHFVDAFKGFTLMAWMKQSRSDVGIFFVEVFKVRPTKEMMLDFSLLKSFPFPKANSLQNGL